jgi:hypothetical protein
MGRLLEAADARRSDYFDAVAALNAVDALAGRFRAHRAVLAALPRAMPGVEPRVREHLDRLLTRILAQIDAGVGPEAGGGA